MTSVSQNRRMLPVVVLRNHQHDARDVGFSKPTDASTIQEVAGREVESNEVFLG
ncbi:hypothetical protein [Runella limosa]|uniref:hypothetical protein n=1 Tax=Runella limosa TaxID=370978 RepID=UPI0003F8C681|nr:hypothetical protein [Runella limosa]